jgi:hypothetical protein
VDLIIRGSLTSKRISDRFRLEISADSRCFQTFTGCRDREVCYLIIRHNPNASHSLNKTFPASIACAKFLTLSNQWSTWPKIDSIEKIYRSTEQIEKKNDKHPRYLAGAFLPGNRSDQHPAPKQDDGTKYQCPRAIETDLQNSIHIGVSVNVSKRKTTVWLTRFEEYFNFYLRSSTTPCTPARSRRASA